MSQPLPNNESDCLVSFQFEQLPFDKPHIPWNRLNGIGLDMCDLCAEENNYNILLPMYEERVEADFDIAYCTKHGPIFIGDELPRRRSI